MGDVICINVTPRLSESTVTISSISPSDIKVVSLGCDTIHVAARSALFKL